MDMDLRTAIVLFGLVIAAIGAFGFIIMRIVIGTRMTKENHPELFVPGLENMNRFQKKSLYNRVTRAHTMKSNGKYFFWMAIVGFAILWGGALYPVFLGSNG